MHTNDLWNCDAYVTCIIFQNTIDAVYIEHTIVLYPTETLQMGYTKVADVIGKMRY